MKVGPLGTSRVIASRRGFFEAFQESWTRRIVESSNRRIVALADAARANQGSTLRSIDENAGHQPYRTAFAFSR